MTQVTGTAPTKTVKELPPAILEAIVAGHIAHEIETVKVSEKVSPTKKEETRDFDALYAMDAEGMALLCGGKIEPQTPAPSEGKDERTDDQRKLGACDHFNYGRILGVRQRERSNLESSLEGPDKEIARLLKVNMASSMFETEAEALDFILTKMRKQGKIAEDYTYSPAA